MSYDEQQLLERAALVKLRTGEPLSFHDMERIIDIINRWPAQISAPGEDERAGLEARLLQVLQNKFFKK